MRQNCGLLVTAVAVSVLFVPGCGSAPTSPPVGSDLDTKITSDELAALAGMWVYERQVVKGNEISITGLKKDTIVISGDLMVRNMFRSDGSALIPMKSTIHVDPSLAPKQMDEEYSVGLGNDRYAGIYKLEEDKLILCYDNTGNQRPTSFDSPPGSTIVLTVLRRRGK